MSIRESRIKLPLKIVSHIFIYLLLVTSLGMSQDFSGLYKDVSPSVVVVIAYDLVTDSISQGSGFFINEGGDVITNYHVIKGSNKIEVMTSDGKKYPVKDTLATDVDSDLFLASVDIPQNMVHPIKISSEIPEIGEDIIIIGCPEGLSQTMTRGIISSVRYLENYGTVIQIDAAISPGSSGSPVINKEGEVIGVATFNREGQNLNFAISSQQVSNLIEEAGIISNSGIKVKMAYTRDGIQYISKERMDENIRHEYAKPGDYREVWVPLDTIVVGRSLDNDESKKLKADLPE